MTAEEHRRLDEATIFLCEVTSHDGDPRTFLADCRHCGAPFWVKPEGCRGGQQLYCVDSHRVLHFYYQNRTTVLARQARYQARRRALAVAS